MPRLSTTKTYLGTLGKGTDTHEVTVAYNKKDGCWRVKTLDTAKTMLKDTSIKGIRAQAKERGTPLHRLWPEIPLTQQSPVATAPPVAVPA